MDKNRVAGSAKKIKGSIKEVVGKTAGNAKLEAEAPLSSPSGPADSLQTSGKRNGSPRPHGDPG